MKLNALILIFIIGSHGTIGQELKKENEKRIPRKEVPTEILEKLAYPISVADKIRFYEEHDGEKRSIEAKMIVRGAFYSIEFAENFKLEDVEKTVLFGELEESVRQGISSYLNEFRRSKIEKTQVQFSSNNLLDAKVIEMSIDNADGDIIRYEIEVSVKEGKKWKAYEVLFDHQGVFLSKRKIIQRASDFILY